MTNNLTIYNLSTLKFFVKIKIDIFNTPYVNKLNPMFDKVPIPEKGRSNRQKEIADKKKELGYNSEGQLTNIQKALLFHTFDTSPDTQSSEKYTANGSKREPSIGAETSDKSIFAASSSAISIKDQKFSAPELKQEVRQNKAKMQTSIKGSMRPTIPKKSEKQIKKEELDRDYWMSQTRGPAAKMQFQLKYGREQLVAQFSRKHYQKFVKGELTQLKRNKAETRGFRSKVNVFERQLQRDNIRFGSAEYIQRAKAFFPGFDPVSSLMKTDPTIVVNDNPALENEADVMGKKAAEGKAVDSKIKPPTEPVSNKVDSEEGSPKTAAEKGVDAIESAIDRKKTIKLDIPFSFKGCNGKISVAGIPRSKNEDKSEAKLAFGNFSGEYLSGKLNASLVKGEQSIVLPGGLVLKFEFEALKLNSDKELDVATLSLTGEKSFKAGGLKGTVFEPYLQTLVDVNSAVKLSVSLESNLNPPDVKRYKKLMNRNKQIRKLESEADVIQNTLKDIEESLDNRKEKFFSENLHKLDDDLDLDQKKKILEKQFKEEIKPLNNKVVDYKNRLRELKKEARRIQKRSETLLKRIKSPILKAVNSSLIKKSAALLIKIGKASDLVESIVFVLKSFTIVVAGGKLTLLKGESVDDMSLHDTSDLLMKTLHDAATDKVVPKGDIPSNKRPEAIPKEIAKQIPDEQVEDISSKLPGHGFPTKNASEASDIDKLGQGNIGSGSNNKTAGNKTNLNTERVDQTEGESDTDKEINTPTKKGNAPKGSEGVEPDGRTLVGGQATGEHNLEAASDGGNSGIDFGTGDTEVTIEENTEITNTSTLEVKGAGDNETEQLETKDFGVFDYIRDEEVSGVTASCQVYATVDDSMRGKENLEITLNVVARYAGTLYTIYFERVKVKVDIGSFKGELWHYVKILESVTAEGDKGRASLNAGKIYKVRPYVKN